MLDALYSKCYEIFDQHVPKASLRFTNHPVWYNAKLINLKNIRNRAYRKFLKPSTHRCKSDDEARFISAKAEFESYQDELFNAFMYDLASNYKKQPKKFWNYINSKCKASSLPGKMYYENEQATSDIEKANMFAKFFASVYTKNERESDDDNALLSHIASRNDSGFLDITITPDIVRQVLKRMDLSKGSGPDKMSPLFLRECADLLDTTCDDLLEIAFRNVLPYIMEDWPFDSHL